MSQASAGGCQHPQSQSASPSCTSPPKVPAQRGQKHAQHQVAFLSCHSGLQQPPFRTCPEATERGLQEGQAPQEQSPDYGGTRGGWPHTAGRPRSHAHTGLRRPLPGDPPHTAPICSNPERTSPSPVSSPVAASLPRLACPAQGFLEQDSQRSLWGVDIRQGSGVEPAGTPRPRLRDYDAVHRGPASWKPT